jgi:hypothetical protein
LQHLEKHFNSRLLHPTFIGIERLPQRLLHEALSSPGL